jgi:putative phosphoesterase
VKALKIGVLSDTHIPMRGKRIPDIVLEAFKDADHIIHAGDLTDLSVLRCLSDISRVTAVSGNSDPPEIKKLLGDDAIIELGGKKFGIFHGHGLFGSTLDRAVERFNNKELDCIIFGHSHNPYCDYHGKTLLFNPGSANDKRMNLYYSFGIIEITDTLKPQIVFFDKNGIVLA